MPRSTFMENPAVMEEVEQKVRDFYNIDGTQQEEARTACR